MKEHLSAWMDGELSDEQASQLLSRLKRDATLRTHWDCYHQIRDALCGAYGPNLCARISARLDAESTMLAPLHRSKTQVTSWRSLQLAASVAALIFSGSIWIFLPDPTQNSPHSAISPAPKAKQIAVPAGADESAYLFAHQSYSASSSVLGVVAYARIISPDMPLRTDRLVK